MYICVYTYIYTYTQTYTFIHIHNQSYQHVSYIIYVYTYICVYNLCIHVYMSMQFFCGEIGLFLRRNNALLLDHTHLRLCIHMQSSFAQKSGSFVEEYCSFVGNALLCGDEIFIFVFIYIFFW